MTEPQREVLVGQHYSARLQKWIDEYDKPSGYPFTRIRLTRVMRFLKDSGVVPKTILDVGCGVGIPSMEIAQTSGAAIHGFDLSPELVEYAQERADRLGLRARYVVGSATDPASYPAGRFDLITAFGVFQHIVEDVAVLRRFAEHVTPDGWIVVSLRNALFGMTTFNRPAYELFRELFREFLASEDGPLLDDFLKSKFDLNLPPPRRGADGAPQIDDLVYKLHNPLTVSDMLAEAGLAPVHMDFYRYHATPPLLASCTPERFETCSLERDDQPNDWRAMFLCSTYIVYCRRARHTD